MVRPWYDHRNLRRQGIPNGSLGADSASGSELLVEQASPVGGSHASAIDDAERRAPSDQAVRYVPSGRVDRTAMVDLRVHLPARGRVDEPRLHVSPPRIESERTGRSRPLRGGGLRVQPAPNARYGAGRQVLAASAESVDRVHEGCFD